MKIILPYTIGSRPFQPQDVDMDKIKESLLAHNIDDAKVVYQGRKAYSQGGDCYIGYLKL